MIQVFGDSQLCINFLLGIYRPRGAYLYRKVEVIKDVIKSMVSQVYFQHISRNSNQVADWLASQARALQGDIILSELGVNTVPGGPAPADMVGALWDIVPENVV